MVDKSSSEPLYIQIQGIIENKIFSGELKPGDRTLSEQEIATKFDVSRVTARKALENLVAKNLLYRQPGKGTFVAEHGMPYGFSTMLSFSRSLSARGFEVHTKMLDKSLVPGSPQIAEQLRISPQIDLVFIRRVRFLDGVPAAIHTSYFDARIYTPLLDIDLTKISLLEAAEQIGRIRMAYSVDSLRAVPTNIPDSEILEIPTGTPALELEGTVFNEHNVPSRYTKGIYRGDMFRLEVKNTQTQFTAFRVERGAVSD
ncbi:MAG: GntR family transcriptional regulator [Spirochaetaceae bacterium]|nr:MAG: GntR family transcriptional regulator [Spirochaetaceae bacterium]